ncbi:hypothetical protein J6590_001094 [Homalodisca vitripennis]|nr:hypothetical protein J6590_001094 [Homalodisca vitripennis]
MNTLRFSILERTQRTKEQLSCKCNTVLRFSGFLKRKQTCRFTKYFAVDLTFVCLEKLNIKWYNKRFVRPTNLTQAPQFSFVKGSKLSPASRSSRVARMLSSNRLVQLLEALQCMNK